VGLWRWCSRLIILFSFVLVGLVGIALWLGVNWLSTERQVTLLAGLALMPLIALSLTRGAALRGLGRVVVGQLPDNIARPATLIILALMSMWLAPEHAPTPHGAMFLHVLAGLLALILATAL